jgi:transcriptional regulator with XRE-family HTH domain
MKTNALPAVAPQEEHIGQVLRDCRESMGYPLEETASALHIRPRYLRAIEQGAWEELPGDAYARGYIRNYAAYLGLNAQALFDRHLDKPISAPQEFFVPKPSSSQHLPSKLLLWIALIGMVALYCYWFFVSHAAASVQLVEDVPDYLLAQAASYRHTAMDTRWRQCLSASDSTCFIALEMRRTVAPASVIYDIMLTPPQGS